MKAVVLLMALLISPFLWSLDLVPEASHIRFISIKKNAIAEVGAFQRFSGTLSAEGGLKLEVELASVDTNIEVRDDRMREFLFESVRFPSARIMARVDLGAIEALKVGELQHQTITGTIDLHGIQREVPVNVAVMRLADGGVRAVTEDPVLLSLKDYNLEAGVDKLQDLAGLPAIARVVPVYFSLTFR